MGQIIADEIRPVELPRGIRTWRECLYLLRVQMCRVYEACLPETSAGMMAAMVTGEKALLDADVRRMFQQAGFSHILAISGMHISLIGMAIYRILRKGRCSYAFRCAMTAGFLMLYGTMIGWGVSARRAIGMFGIYLLAQYLGKGYDLWSSLSVMAVVILTDNPFWIADMGFRFSFVAVAAVAVSNEVLSSDIDISISEEKSRWFRPVWMAVLLQLFTLPLVAYSYYELPVYALFLNLLLLPYAGVIVGCGLAGGLIGIRCLAAARVLLLPCRIVATVYVWACGRVEALPYASLICGQPPAEKLVLYYLLLFTALFIGRKICTGQRHTMAWLPATAFVLVALLLVPARDQRGFEISYLDVGQGDGAMIRTASGTVCFVDGGSTDVTGVGTYRILPFLKSKGVRAVDYWVISHADEDHVNGFYEVLESGYLVRRVVITNYMPDSLAKQKLLQTLASYRVPVMQVKAGQMLYLDRVRRGAECDVVSDAMRAGARLRFLAPARQLTDSNAACLVCLYEDAHVKALFTGDIGAEQERELLQCGLVQPVDLYKAAHHGSRYSNTEEFLAMLSPRLSVISCARRNRYGHPAQEAIEHIQASSSHILYTMYSGQIKVRLSQGGLTVCEYVSGNRSE